MRKAPVRVKWALFAASDKWEEKSVSCPRENFPHTSPSALTSSFHLCPHRGWAGTDIMTEHALIMCREPGRPSTLDKGHEEGDSAYANAGSSLRNPPGYSRASPPQKNQDTRTESGASRAEMPGAFSLISQSLRMTIRVWMFWTSSQRQGYSLR